MPPLESDSDATRLYALVIVCEVLVIAALWLVGRAFSV
jgi:hypothetical protein